LKKVLADEASPRDSPRSAGSELFSSLKRQDTEGRVEEALERQPMSGLTQGLHPLLKLDFDAGEAFQIFQHGRILKL